jgi:pantetheine-phosphate adenylyltransferase
MALMNRQLFPEVETIFLAPDEHYSYLSASLVREIASLGGDIAQFVAPPVLTALQQKLSAT